MYISKFNFVLLEINQFTTVGRTPEKSCVIALTCLKSPSSMQLHGDFFNSFNYLSFR